MAVPVAFGKGAHVARRERMVAEVVDQHRLPLDHDQQFVLPFVPVALRRPRPRLEDDMAGAEIGQARRRREAPVPAPVHLVGVDRGIAGGVALRDGIEVELGHGESIARTA